MIRQVFLILAVIISTVEYKLAEVIIWHIAISSHKYRLVKGIYHHKDAARLRGVSFCFRFHSR